MHYALHSIKHGNRRGLQVGLATTFLMGAVFLGTQINEYTKAGFAISDGAFASVFYGLTGLHGAHVFVGLTLLAIMNIRTLRGHFTEDAHMGVECAGIYWHFVDVMWIIVFSTVYVL
jgi:cytochrome c oxidase subunit 3